MATLVVALITSMPAPVQAAKKPRPDLVIAGKRKVDPTHRFYQSSLPVQFKAKTKNKGEARARASETMLRWESRGEDREGSGIATLDVPALKPGKGFRGGAGGSVRETLTPGVYNAVICADAADRVRESNERNNCAKAGVIYVIAYEWKGRISGSAAIDIGVSEGWSANDARFVFSKIHPEGWVSYRFQGSVRYTLSGTDPEGCTHGGSGTIPLSLIDRPGAFDDEQGLWVDYRKGLYWGLEQDPTGTHFSYWVACGAVADPDAIEGPLNAAAGFFVIDPIDAKPLDDVNQLAGFYSEPNDVADLSPYRWYWELRARGLAG